MQTQLADFVKSRAEHQEIESILRSCVHCGFCNATCPTYQLTGDELDGPRGRIYLLKQMLEGATVSTTTQRHLDRCLSCRSCETTCPSGVEYGRLSDLGRQIIEEQVPRSLLDKLQRQLMLRVFPYRQRFKVLMQLAKLLKPFLPANLANKISAENSAVINHLDMTHQRKVLILPGCVQPTLAPAIDASVRRVLDKLKISVIALDSSQCCGALNYHLSDQEQAKEFAKSNIDQCWPYIEQGIEGIVMSASGCGLMLKEYDILLQFDEQYKDKARRFSKLVKDLSEIMAGEDLSALKQQPKTIAYQSPCTMQHGQKLDGVVESILKQTGFQLNRVDNVHLCCGSAGVYSLLQPALSEQLRSDKLKSLCQQPVDYIATANIGCLTHLQAKTKVPVKHWIELLDEDNFSNTH